MLGTPIADCCGGNNAHGALYLGPEHNGVRMNADPSNPLPFASPGSDKFREEQKAEFDLLGRNLTWAADPPVNLAPAQAAVPMPAGPGLILYSCDGKLYLMDPDGKNERRIVPSWLKGPMRTRRSLPLVRDSR